MTAIADFSEPIPLSLPEELASLVTAYIEYDVRLPSNVIASFAITLNDQFGDCDSAKAMRSAGALAFGHVSVFGLPDGDPDAFSWEITSEGVGLVFRFGVIPPASQVQATSIALLKQFFQEIGDVAPDLPRITITAPSPPAAFQLVSRARAELKRSPVRHAPVYH